MIEKHEIFSQFQDKEHIAMTLGDTLVELKNLPTNSFKLAVSSPPYNIGKEYEKQVKLQDYLNWQTEIIQQLVRIVSDRWEICSACNYSGFLGNTHFTVIFRLELAPPDAMKGTPALASRLTPNSSVTSLTSALPKLRKAWRVLRV